MANETPPVVETPQVSPDTNVAPNLDAELDAALSKSFPNNSQPNETIQEPSKVEDKAQAKPEVKIEDKPESKQDNKPKDKLVEDEKPLLSPDEIDKIEPKKQDAWTALKNNNKRSLRLIEQKDSEIQRLKAVVAEKGQLSQKELDALKAENGELTKYRAMIDIQSDPEFLSKFDHKIEKNISSLQGMLKEMNISADQIKQIDFRNPDLMGAIVANVTENKNIFVASKFKNKVQEIVDLTEQRNEALAEQKEKYKETLEARKKQAFEKDVESEGKALKRLEAISVAKDNTGNPAFPFLNKKEAKDGATQPEIDQINSHNRLVELMVQKVQQAYKAESPEERMEASVAAAAAHYYIALYKAEASKRKSVEEELKKIASVSSETEKIKLPTALKRNGNNFDRLDTDEALSAHFGGKFGI